MNTLAEQFASALYDDGQCFETDVGVTFEELIDRMGATVTYASREHTDGVIQYADGTRYGHIHGDPIRYEFSDGSAVVEAGGAWDIEGETRYSWP